MFTKSDHILARRPITDKIGTMIWQFDNDIDVQFSLAKLMGIKYIRFNLFQSLQQLNNAPTNDSYTVDNEVIQKAISNGFNPIVGLTTDTGGGGFSDDSTTHSVMNPTQLANYKLHWQGLVDHWKNNNIIWEALNEANGNFFSANDACNNTDVVGAWVDLDKFLANYCRNNDPTGTFSTLCTIEYPGVHHPDDTHSSNYIDGVRNSINIANTDGLFNSDADLISTHPYIEESSNNGCPEILIRDGTSASMPSGVTQPFISTEFGYSRQCINPNDKAYSWQGLWDWDSAIELTLREFLIQDLLDYRVISIYAMETGSNYNMSNNGILNPLGLAVSNFISVMNGRTLVEKIPVISNGNDFLDDVYCLRYSKQGSSDLIVYWTPIFSPYDFSITVNNNTYNLRATTMPQFLNL